MSNIFNPFGKEFRTVIEADLEVLKTVSEGWYVEYKETKLSGQRIAKSISSFSNSHGGIYFVGVEGDKTNNCAKNILGVDDSPDVIRDSISGNLQPFPFFETFVIPLQNGKKVLMVIVPSGSNPPYVNSDGRIYRRQESASDPISENNRYSIDELYRKSKNYEEELEQFRTFDLGYCKAEENVPYLEIFINTTPFRHFFLENFFSSANIQKVFEQLNGTYTNTLSGTDITFSGSIKFDSLSTYADSISLRLLEGHDLAYNGMTAIIDIYGNLKYAIPLAEKQEFTKDFSDRYTKMLNRSNPESHSYLKLLDARSILGAVFCLVAKYVDYLDQNGYKGEIEVKIRLKNCFRTTLYISSEEFIQHVEKYGIPINMKDEQCFPRYSLSFKLDEVKKQPTISCFAIFSHISNALGVPANIAISSLINEISKNPINIDTNKK